MRRALAVSVLLLGCGPQVGSEPVPALDAEVYATHVHPLVRFSCASLDCHGDEGRPLRLYAEDGLRRSAELRGQPLSPEEAAWNVTAFGGIDPAPASPDAHLALLAPLSVESGGTAHVGGDLWPSREDPAYRCLRAWLAGEEDAAACAEASAAVDPYADAP